MPGRLFGGRLRPASYACQPCLNASLAPDHPPPSADSAVETASACVEPNPSAAVNWIVLPPPSTRPVWTTLPLFAAASDVVSARDSSSSTRPSEALPAKPFVLSLVNGA